MITAQIPLNEKERLAELHRLKILDTPQEEAFDKLTLLAVQICNVPIAGISFIDGSRQWVKSLIGLNAQGSNNYSDRDISFCSHAILSDDFFEVNDALEDERFHDNPAVQNDPYIRYYGAMPLITSKGFSLGTICVADVVPGQLSKEQISALKILSNQIIQLIELKAANWNISQTAETQKRVISIMSHDIRSPLYSIKTILDYPPEKTSSQEEQRQIFSTLSKNLNRTLLLANNLVNWGKTQLEHKEQNVVFNLQGVVDECMEQAELNILLKQNEIKNYIPPDIFVKGDKETIQFILRNLISNANNFTENGKIKISFYKKDNKCFLKVSDTGVGIEANKIIQIMQNTGFFHTTGTRNEKGSGLGLSLIKNYLHRTGNDFKIKSVLKKGTSVTFSICLTKELITVFA